MIETCEARTKSGERCKREPLEGFTLCAMHQRIAQEQFDAALEQALADDLERARRSHVETGGDTSLVSDLSIHAGDEQPPAVAVVMRALDALTTGEWRDERPSDAELSRTLADALHEEGGTEADLDALIAEGVIDEWARGYWRSLAHV